MGPRLEGRGELSSLAGSGMVEPLLQWGRGWKAAERRSRPLGGLLPGGASMGPRLEGRGELFPLLTEVRIAGRFNGAAAGRPRRARRSRYR